MATDKTGVLRARVPVEVIGALELKAEACEVPVGTLVRIILTNYCIREGLWNGKTTGKKHGV